MKREILVAIAGASIVVAGLAACSSDKSNTSSSGSTSPSTPSATTSASGNAAAGSTKVVIDGQDQNVQGTVACTTSNGNVNIAMGGYTTGIGVVLTDANPPVVKSVGLGNVNGVTLGYSSNSGQGNAQATKNGNSYKITGTATGVDMSNPTAPVNKRFEIDVTCP